jgi:hypothetical protein
MREYGARGIAWEPEWDGDYAADKGWLAPPVALAVADWLEAEASRHEVLSVDFDVSNCCRMPQALAVARAYLGEDQ